MRNPPPPSTNLHIFVEYQYLLDVKLPKAVLTHNPIFFLYYFTYKLPMKTVYCNEILQDKYIKLIKKKNSVPGNANHCIPDFFSESIPIWQEAGLVAAWLRVPIMVSELIPVAARHGFTFHHAEGGTASLYRWLPSDQTDKVPRFATHQVGVAGREQDSSYCRPHDNIIMEYLFKALTKSQNV